MVLIKSLVVFIGIASVQAACVPKGYKQRSSRTSKTYNAVQATAVASNAYTGKSSSATIDRSTATASQPSATASSTSDYGPPQTPSSTTPANGSWWKPTLDTKLHYQLGKDFDLATDVKDGVTAYGIDGYVTTAEVVSSMRTKGLDAICYFSAGSSEKGRPDDGDIPSEAKGNVLDGWPDENWLDIRNTAVRNVMIERMKICKQKGFVAVDPDNVDGYSNKSGFDLTAADQLEYNKFLSDTAHGLGLGVGLKNSVAQIADLVDSFDFAI
ncbi:hypothetical protein CXG81DRAFT_15979, partial [Caulochytrium protostelioides]